MAKLVLQDVNSGYQAMTKVNANNDKIEEAFENTVSRDGTGPNQMEAPLDLNGNPVINLGSPTSPTDAARWADVLEVVEVTGTPVPSMTGNEGKVLTTDGSVLVFDDVQPAALPLFTTTNPGAVPESTTDTGSQVLTDAGWATKADADLPELTAVNVFEAAQVHEVVNLTYSSSLPIDTELGNNYHVLLEGGVTFTFDNEVNGTNFILILEQDTTGNRGATWPDNVKWASGNPPTLSVQPGGVDIVKLVYDGSDWFGTQLNTPYVEAEETSTYSLVLSTNEKNVDVFRRLGSPTDVGTYSVLIDDGVVIHSDSTVDPALDFGGAFASGTVVTVTSRGFVLGKGGAGAGGQGLHDDGDSDVGFGGGDAEAGGNAIRGPASGVTVLFNNTLGRVWGGGGGGGAGGVATSDLSVAASGGGGGGAGLGAGGPGVTVHRRGNSAHIESSRGSPGSLGLSGASAGGAAGTGDDQGSANYGVSGAGGDYGAAGTNGTAATTEGSLLSAPSAGGAAGKAVALGAGTFTFTGGSGSPNVKGAVS